MKPKHCSDQDPQPKNYFLLQELGKSEGDNFSVFDLKTLTRHPQRLYFLQLGTRLRLSEETRVSL